MYLSRRKSESIGKYAIPRFNPSTFEYFDYSVCRMRLLNGNTIDFQKIELIRDQILVCQNTYPEGGTKNMLPCVNSVVITNFAQPAKKRSSPSCKTAYEHVYSLHTQAIKSAKAGDCTKAKGQFESTIHEWREMSNNESCNKENINLAKDGYDRARNDFDVLKSKYCPSLVE